MTLEELVQLNAPDNPGVYRFLGKDDKILYIGKATSLRQRTRSYFANDLLYTRGKHIVDMIVLAKTVKFTPTDSVLEALILEASLIKKHQPYYNTKEKDNKSFNYVVITNEAFPRVLSIRERTMLSGNKEIEKLYKYIFGPFPHGTNLIEALKLIRRIFPFRDKCIPFNVRPAQIDEIRGEGKAARKAYSDMLTESQGPRNDEVRHLGGSQGKPCFNRQLGLCPGVCSGEITAKDYNEQVRNIALFFEGKKNIVLKRVEKAMHAYAKRREFEEAQEQKKILFGLKHINDVSLIKEEIREISIRSSRKRERAYRIEAYDVAHISGKYTVGVMVVVEDGVPKKSDYRKFKIRIDAEKSNDPLHLEEVLRRRFGHTEWQKPDLIVVDGSTAQKRVAEKVLKEFKLEIPVVGVVKDARHKPKAIIGNKEIAESYKHGILIGNAESHRFAVTYHRLLRERLK